MNEREKYFMIELSDGDLWYIMHFHISDVMCKYTEEISDWAMKCEIGDKTSYKKFTIKRIQ
jgi:hypothetical protein